MEYHKSPVVHEDFFVTSRNAYSTSKTFELIKFMCGGPHIT